MIALALIVARRARSALLVAGGAYMCLVAGVFAASLDRGFVASGTLERRLWLGQAAALTGIALGVAWSWVRTRRARTAVARLVVELARSPPPGGLSAALASLVGDPGLVLAYPLGDSGRLVDALGRPVELPVGRERTRLVHDGRAVAVLAHTPGLLDDEQLVHEVTAAARLALENERLQAEVHARLEELRASRARIVGAGDAERKRLERDLHDGAQQRLMGVSLSLSLVRSQLPAVARLDEAAVELRSAIAELRELAHGIFPAVLADEGLAAAVEAFAEEAHVPLRIDGLPERRFPARVETAAYTVVVEAARAATYSAAVRARCTEETLALEIESRGFRDTLDVVGLEDRVGALDGRLALERRTNGSVTIRAELPCAS
jgi:signal transduction histidine kinase